MKLSASTVWLFLPGFLLSLLGLFVCYSIMPQEFTSQVIFLLLGIGIFLTFSLINYKLLSAFFPFLYFFQIILLVATLIFGLNIRGSSRWLDLGFLSLQTSELMKPILVGMYSTMSSRLWCRSITDFTKAIGLVAVPSLLMFLQPDLGSTIIIASIGFFLILNLQPAKRYLVLILLAALAGMPLVWHFLEPYQKTRVYTFLSPEADPLGASYNQIQAVIAAGSGGFAGKGLGKGTQSHLHFLPEKHTDFFFASLGEEFGFLGSFTVITLFGILAGHLLALAKKAQDKSLRTVFLGAFIMIFLQASIHIGINLGILPVTGITLPFLSVGGSSMLTSWLMLGIASSACNEVRDERAVFLT